MVVVFDCAELANQGKETSGEFRLMIWACRSRNFSPGDRQYHLAVAGVKALAPGMAYRNFKATMPIQGRLPPGPYYFAASLEELRQGGYEHRQSVFFPDAIQAP